MKKIILITSILFLASSACKKDDGSPDNPTAPANESEIITTVKLLLMDSNGNQTTATWKDLDGIGPTPPLVEQLNLNSNQWYTGIVLLLDETKTPVDTISHEVHNEAEAHQFFYTVSGSAHGNATFSRTDNDVNQLPVGLRIVVTVLDSSSGSLKVVLKHYDGIPKSTDPSIGETDVQVTFPLVIAP